MGSYPAVNVIPVDSSLNEFLFISLVPSMDHKAFGEEVLRLLNDRSRRSKFEINARKKAQRHFKWDTIASNYERVLRTKALKTSNVC